MRGCAFSRGTPTGSGGNSPLVTSAETRVPRIPTISVGEETAVRHITSGGFFVTSTQEITWNGLEREPRQVEHWYRFLRTPRSAFTDVKFPFPPPRDLQGDQLSLVINLAADKTALEDSLDIASTAFVGLGMRITILDTRFVPPGGIFDPELLVQPGTFSNVENGFGFIGSVGRFSAEWVLKEESLHILGYLPVKDAFGKTELPVALEGLQPGDVLVSID